MILTAALLAFASGADGKGALTLWPLFGAVNQTLASLTLIIITIYLKGKGGYKWVIAGIPAIIMSFITFYATISNQLTYIKNSNTLLIIINSIIILCCLRVVIESIIKLQKKNIGLNEKF